MINQQIVHPSFSTTAPVTCPGNPTFTVSDEAGLRAAIQAAQPGDVIAIQGMVGIAANVFIGTPNVTLTCATPGSGLFALSTSVGFLIVVNVGGSGVVVDRLVLDGSGTGTLGDPFSNGGPYTAQDFFGPGLPVPNVRFSNNTVSCGPGFCAFFAGTSGAVIINNTFTSGGSLTTGVHVQLGVDFIDNVRIQGNTIAATAPSTFFRFGGIRVIGARNVVVADNVVTGPWFNSISVAFLTKSQITMNRFEGAAVRGILLGNPRRFAPPIISEQDNVFSNNLATGAGSLATDASHAGLFVAQACSNVFLGNNLQGNVGNVGAIFAATTGANTLVGDGTIVIDNGAFDCDGDGVNDPNIITGAGAVRSGMTLGDVVSDAVGSPNRITAK